jgi:hypothetical protein
MTNFIIKTKVLGFTIFQQEKNFYTIGDACNFAAKRSFFGVVKTTAIYNY